MKQLCEICGSKYREFYSGDIRDGVYGGVKHSAIIYECNECGVQRLRESDCIPDEYYETGKYRKKLEESLNGEKAVVEQDKMQHFTLKSIFPTSLRNKSVLDVGCGVGSLLDMLKSVSFSQIGIEPCGPYLESLSKRGYKVYPSLSDAAKENINSIDYAFSIQVIEHVKNPIKFLKEIRSIIKPGGRLLISTPNRDDILMTLLSDNFYPFFYRTQHRWYFDENSLTKCAELAGFEVESFNFIHRYGMANTLYWLRDKIPNGNIRIDGINNMADSLWKTYLENNKQSDTIFIKLKIPESD